MAGDLLKAFNAREPRALARIRWNHPRFRKLFDAEITSTKFALADAQLVIARLHHIESWPMLLQHVESMERANPAVKRFEEAADAIISENLALLQAMLDAYSELLRERSSRAHHSALLHYVSANGVEDYRQISPPNIVEITRMLLDAGAEVDATSNAYGGRSTTLGLHLLRRGAKPDNLYGAAALGDASAVRQLLPQANNDLRDHSLLIAAQCDSLAEVALLLENGANVGARDGMTALHWASANGNIAIMERLLSEGAPLEALNEFGGTVLSSSIWFAYHAWPEDFRRRDYPAIFDKLISAGARTDFYPEMQQDMDGLYQRAKG